MKALSNTCAVVGIAAVLAVSGSAAEAKGVDHSIKLVRHPGPAPKGFNKDGYSFVCSTYWRCGNYNIAF